MTPGRDDDLPGTLEVGVGQVVRLPLPGRASGAGHRWRVAAPSGAGAPTPEGAAEAADVRVEVGSLPAAPDTPGGPPPTSTSAPEVLVVEGRAPGTVDVELRLARAWAPDEPLATHVLTVVVGA